MATVVVFLWVTPEGGGLKPCVLARPGVSPLVEGGGQGVIGEWCVGAKVWISALTQAENRMRATA